MFPSGTHLFVKELSGFLGVGKTTVATRYDIAVLTDAEFLADPGAWRVYANEFPAWHVIRGEAA